MIKKITILAALTLFTLIIASPAMMYAQTYQPKTAIDKILDYKQGLDLSESQIKKLSLVNHTIVEKMGETLRQADIRKTEIDDFTANWSNVHGIAVDRLIKEYYDFMAEFKKLELEAIMKAKAILTEEQLKRFTELASIESLMIRVENELVSLY
jgi:hypothetical protein